MSKTYEFNELEALQLGQAIQGALREQSPLKLTISRCAKALESFIGQYSEKKQLLMETIVVKDENGGLCSIAGLEGDPVTITDYQLSVSEAEAVDAFRAISEDHFRRVLRYGSRCFWKSSVYLSYTSRLMNKGNNRELARQYLANFPGYLKWGASKLAEKLDVSHADIVDIKTELRLNDKPFRRLFFDIETSYNIAKVWRTGWKLNIGPHQIIQERKVISVSWKWHDEDKVHNLAWDKDQCDKSMLISFNKVLEQADEVIGHNSDRFDIPWLRTRCLYHRIPFRTYIKSFDTLKKVKSAFNFQSNKLDYIASFLGFGHKLPTNMALWDRIILNKEPEALKEMVEYCLDKGVIIFPYCR